MASCKPLHRAVSQQRKIIKENHYKASCKPLNRAVGHPRKVMKESHYKASCKPLNRTVSQLGKVIKVYTVLSSHVRSPRILLGLAFSRAHGHLEALVDSKHSLVYI